MNYEFNLLHHVGVVAKRVHAAAHKGTTIPLRAQRAEGVKKEVIVDPVEYRKQQTFWRGLPKVIHSNKNGPSWKTWCHITGPGQWGEI